MKICKKHLVFEATNKKLDRHRVKNWYKLFLSKASKILTQCLTKCGQTL